MNVRLNEKVKKSDSKMWTNPTTAIGSRALAVVLSILTLLPSVVMAQSDFDISDLRRELEELRTAPPEPSDNFESRNAMLEQQELQLLRQIEDQVPTMAEKAPEATVETATPDVMPESPTIRAMLKEPKVQEPVIEAKPELLSPTEHQEKVVVDTTAVDSLRKQLSEVQSAKEIALKKQTKLGSELAQLTAKVKELESRNSRLSSQLLLAETEVVRLAEELEKFSAARLAGISGAQRVAPSQEPIDSSNRGIPDSSGSVARKASADAVAGARDEESLIATVIAPKANLRSGPGTNNAPIMQVSKGTRLLVETRQGSWYRVVSPTGSRAWIFGDVIAFGSRGSRSPSGTVSISSVRSSSL
jgi:septal ring factor EnvC (AmiA/AmiB activator)